jgi:hypothetical protein
MVSMDIKNRRFLPSAALAFFVAGVIPIGYGFTQVENALRWFRLGALGWDVAYFIVLADNFMQKSPVATRGGLVRYEDGVFKYAIPYVLLVVFGLGLFLVLIFSL